MNSKVVFSQIGSRDHYSYANALARADKLQALVTDIWLSGRAASAVRLLPLGCLRKLGSRYNEQIPSARVSSMRMSGYVHYLCEKASPRFHEVKCAALDRMAAKILAETHAGSALGYMAAMRHTIRFAVREGLRTGVIAYDGCQAADDIYAHEHGLHPDWGAGVPRRSNAFYDSIAEEFTHANYVIVNSNWSRSLLQRSGVPSGKICLVPLSYSPQPNVSGVRATRGPLNVLWVGNVSLGKGFYYFAEAVKSYYRNDPRCVFHVVGSINVNKSKLARLPDNVFIHGPVPRFEVANFYKNADLMVFPTLSDGFGLVQLEAMSFGVPVLASRFCADVVEHMVSGFVLDDVSSTSIARWLDFALANRDTLAEMRPACMKRAGAFSEHAFADALLNIV